MSENPVDKPSEDAHPTLAELRLRIQALAAGTDPTDGGFVVACARTGIRPAPVGGYRFDCRATAAEAATYVEQYRRRLHDLDPDTPRYDPVVHEVGVGQRWVPAVASAWPEWLPTPGEDRWRADTLECEGTAEDPAARPDGERGAGQQYDRVQRPDDRWFSTD